LRVLLFYHFLSVFAIPYRVYNAYVTIRYQTGIATMVQFVIMALLSLANGINSMITTCRIDSSSCTINIMLSLLVFLLTAGWFGAVWVIGTMAQESRDKRLAILLMFIELFIIGVALLNARHHTDALSLITSIIDICLALWVIVLAFRLSRSGGKRIRSRRTKARPSSLQ